MSEPERQLSDEERAERAWFAFINQFLDDAVRMEFDVTDDQRRPEKNRPDPGE